MKPRAKRSVVEMHQTTVDYSESMIENAHIQILNDSENSTTTVQVSVNNYNSTVVHVIVLPAAVTTISKRSF